MWSYFVLWIVATLAVNEYGEIPSIAALPDTTAKEVQMIQEFNTKTEALDFIANYKQTSEHSWSKDFKLDSINWKSESTLQASKANQLAQSLSELNNLFDVNSGIIPQVNKILEMQGYGHLARKLPPKPQTATEPEVDGAEKEAENVSRGE